jgi:AcrR family transcriptional regulator
VGSYHHGNLRAALLEAAVELARAQGPDGVVLREVARRSGVSHNAAYRHFADRDELLGEVAAVAADRLEEAMRRRLDQLDEPDSARLAIRRLHEVGQAYVEFALAEPGLFAVAFSADDDQPPQDPARQGRAAPEMAAPEKAAPEKAAPEKAAPKMAAPETAGHDAGAYMLLGQCLDDLVEVGAMPRERREGADLGCWAAVHGFSVLCLSGPLRQLPAGERSAALQVLLTVIERGLTTP